MVPAMFLFFKSQTRHRTAWFVSWFHSGFWFRITCFFWRNLVSTSLLCDLPVNSFRHAGLLVPGHPMWSPGHLVWEPSFPSCWSKTSHLGSMIHFSKEMKYSTRMHSSEIRTGRYNGSTRCQYWGSVYRGSAQPPPLWTDASENITFPCSRKILNQWWYL